MQHENKRETPLELREFLIIACLKHSGLVVPGSYHGPGWVLDSTVIFLVFIFWVFLLYCFHFPWTPEILQSTYKYVGDLVITLPR